MADSKYGSLTMWGWVPSTPCYIASLDNSTRSSSPKPLVDELDVENEYDPAFRSLRGQSESLKRTFQDLSFEYGGLKYESRRVTAIYDHYYRSDNNTPSSTLATQDISEIDGDTLRGVHMQLHVENQQQEEFFGNYIRRARTIFGQLEVLFESSDVLLDKLRVLHYPTDEVRHIARRDKLLHAQKNLDFLIKELHSEVSAFLSSRLATTYSS